MAPCGQRTSGTCGDAHDHDTAHDTLQADHKRPRTIGGPRAGHARRLPGHAHRLTPGAPGRARPTGGDLALLGQANLTQAPACHGVHSLRARVADTPTALPPIRSPSSSSSIRSARGCPQEREDDFVVHRCTGRGIPGHVTEAVRGRGRAVCKPIAPPRVVVGGHAHRRGHTVQPLPQAVGLGADCGLQPSRPGDA